MREKKPDNAINLQIVNKYERPEEQFFCHHQRIILDVESRLIKCNQCGLVMDGFTWILSRAQEQRATEFEVEWLTKDRNRLRTEIEDLKRQKNNLKGQIKRMTNKL